MSCEANFEAPSNSSGLMYAPISDREAHKLQHVRITYRDNSLPIPLLNDSDRTTITDIVTWHDHSKVFRVEGRNMFIPRAEPCGEYDTIQIGGAGYRSFSYYYKETRLAVIDNDEFIRPPSTSNFLHSMPDMHETAEILPDGSIRFIPPPARYTGGYLQEEAHSKFDATMTVASWTDRPFLCPIPEAIGRYPRIRGDYGQLFFIVTSVPFRGKRIGDIISDYRKGTRVSAQEMNTIMTRGMFYLGASLRHLHDRGYTHMQPHFGNCFYSDGKFLLADFATMSEIRHPLAITFDVYQAIRSALNCAIILRGDKLQAQTLSADNPLIVDTNEDDLTIFNNILSVIFGGYIGKHVSIQVDSSTAERIMNLDAITRDPSHTRYMYQPGPAVIEVDRIMEEIRRHL